MSDPTRGEAWRALAVHHERVAGLDLRELFAGDPGRGERMAAEAAGLYLDWSKNRVTDQTMELLGRLAEETALADRIEAMFEGRRINVTEDRPALHVALRAPRGETILVDGEDVVPAVHAPMREEWGQPDRVHPQRARPTGQVVEMRGDTGQVSDAVAVRIGKGAGIDLVDDGSIPSGAVHPSRIWAGTPQATPARTVARVVMITNAPAPTNSGVAAHRSTSTPAAARDSGHDDAAHQGQAHDPTDHVLRRAFVYRGVLPPAVETCISPTVD